MKIFLAQVVHFKYCKPLQAHELKLEYPSILRMKFILCAKTAQKYQNPATKFVDLHIKFTRSSNLASTFYMVFN